MQKNLKQSMGMMQSSSAAIRCGIPARTQQPFLLNDIQPQIKETAYAPSFGVEIPLTCRANTLLHSKSFQHYPVGKSGVDMIHELTGCHAEWVVDPTFFDSG